MKSKLAKISDSLRKLSTRDKYIASAFIVALAIGFVLFIYAFRGAIVTKESQLLEGGTVVQIDESGLQKYRHPLTGETMEEPLEKLPQAIAVMIDHSAYAWPQIGTDQAFLVYEAPVEGNIPRLMAFYVEGDTVPEIGPVRSARPYFVEWANELDAMYAHVGGSPDGLDLVRELGVFDLNQFFNGDRFWRSTRRSAPHNVFTSTEKLKQALQEAREEDREVELDYEPWLFQTDRNKTPESGDGIKVDFNGSEIYSVRWEYKALDNRYLRYQGSKPYMTADDLRVLADNVAVMITDIEVIDGVGRKSLRTIGEGEAVILQNGSLIEGTWKKESADSRLRFYDDDGNEIKMNPGTTWIEVVGDRSLVEIIEE